MYLCRRIAQISGLKSLSLTTNGVLLSYFAKDLFKAGRFDLDTLNPRKFASITRRDCFREVWQGIELAREVGFYPIKLNVVVMREVDDDNEDLLLA